MYQEEHHDAEEAKRSKGLTWIRHGARNRKNSFKARRVKQKLTKARWRFDRKHGLDANIGTGFLGRNRNNQKRLRTRQTPESYCETVVSEEYSVPRKQPPQTDFANSTVSSLPTKTFSTVTTPDVNCEHVEITPIQNMPYAHGGYFGAAPFMLADPVWAAILRELMPDVYVEVGKRINFARNAKLMHWAENNPVVAAFGTMHERENKNNGNSLDQAKSIPLEWDVFLDPNLVKRLLKVIKDLEQHDKETDKKQRNNKENYKKNSSRKNSTPFLRRSSRSTPSEQTNSREIERLHIQEEVHRVTTLLIEKMLIAHGSLPQIIMEQTGRFRQFNFKSVKRQRRTVGGGIRAREWLAVYARALLLGLDPTSILFPGDVNGTTSKQRGVQSILEEEESNGSESSRDANEARKLEQQHPFRRLPTGKQVAAIAANSIRDLRALVESSSSSNNHSSPLLANNSESEFLLRHLNTISRRLSRATSLRSAGQRPFTTMKDSIEIVKRITGSKLRLVIDVKSRCVPKKVWALVVDALRDCGAEVDGIASFTPSEIRGISEMCSQPVKEIFFFHSAGDLQKACHSELQPHDTVFFNAGSLLADGASLRRKSSEKKKKNKKKKKPQNQGPVNYGAVKKTLGAFWKRFDSEKIMNDYEIQPFAFPNEEINGEQLSTVADYKEHYQLNIGLYSQEFAVDEQAIELLVQHVNANPAVFNLGLCWGGLNGHTIYGIKPRRFHRTDGMWNQRYVGMKWDKSLKPGDAVLN